MQWEIKKTAFFYDCHFTSLKSELECHKNNSLLAQRREKKKKKKESKGEIQISHKEVPRLPAALKPRESALLFQLPLISGPGTSVDFLIDPLHFVVLAFLAAEWTVFPPALPLARFSSFLHPDCEDGRGPSPGWACEKHTRTAIPDKQALAGGCRGPGAGAAPLSHLYLPARLCSPGKMRTGRLVFTCSRADGQPLRQQQRVPCTESGNQIVKFSFPCLPGNVECG